LIKSLAGRFVKNIKICMGTYSSFANICGWIVLLKVVENMAVTDLEKRFSFTDIKNAKARLRN